ncbi:MAG: DUF2141 domain-containing protein [Elusimicrobiaceae bacterium]
MKKVFAILFLSGFTALSFASELGKIVIKVNNLRNNNGQIVGAVFNSGSGFPADFSAALRKESAKITGNAAELVFSSVPYGRYAAVIAHDEDADNALDLPAEGVGVSNSSVSLFTPPSFDYAAFKLNSPEMEITVSPNYSPEFSRRNFPKNRLGVKTGDITVVLSGFSSDAGLAMVSLYAVSEGFPYEFEKAALSSYAEIRGGESKVVFRDVPYGPYAIVAFHDVNANGKLDMVNGAPDEEMGTSGAGEVLFDSAVFNVDSATLAMAVNIRYDVKGSGARVKVMNPARGGDLVFNIASVPNGRGVVRVELYASPDGFPFDTAKKTFSAFAYVKNNAASVMFKDIPFGSYAATVYHDENGNGVFDKDIFGLPLEAYGFSNNKIGFKGSPPEYKEAEFTFEKDGQSLAVVLKTR